MFRHILASYCCVSLRFENVSIISQREYGIHVNMEEKKREEGRERETEKTATEIKA